MSLRIRNCIQVVFVYRSSWGPQTARHVHWIFSSLIASGMIREFDTFLFSGRIVWELAEMSSSLWQVKLVLDTIGFPPLTLHRSRLPCEITPPGAYPDMEGGSCGGSWRRNKWEELCYLKRIYYVHYFKTFFLFSRQNAWKLVSDPMDPSFCALHLFNVHYQNYTYDTHDALLLLTIDQENLEYYLFTPALWLFKRQNGKQINNLNLTL